MSRLVYCHARCIALAWIGVAFFQLSVGGSPAPTLSQPASNAIANTTVVFVEWNGGPHSQYQVRATRGNDPDSSSAWDSGEVASDRNFAWTGPLPDLTTYYLFVRLGDSAGWGPWSGANRTFRVKTTSPPAGDNVVRVNGKSLCDNSGPFLGLGVSYFQALRRAKFDRPRLTNDLALLASKGFNYVRILTMVNWDELEIAPVSFVNKAGHAVAGWPDYAQQFRDLLDIVAAHGMRTEVTLFADAKYVMPGKAARQAHLDLILAALAGREHKVMHLEVANEAWQNGFPGSTGVTDLREFAQYLAHRTSVPVAITSNDDLSDAGLTALNAGSAADLATVHFSRDLGTVEGGWLPVRDCYRAGNLPGVPPVTSNEPIGPGSSVSTENDPIKLCSAAIFAWIANLPAYVYHTKAGVQGWTRCCPPSGPEARFENMAGLSAYQHLRAILPGDLASWVRNDGLEASAPFTVFCNGQPNQYWPAVPSPTSGCDRNIGSANGREFVCFPMGILGGGVTLQARRALNFQVFNPLTGAAVSNVTMNAGNSIALPPGPGAYLLRGSFSDLHTPPVPHGPQRNLSRPIASGGLPHRVHVFEDFETEIEKRWWLRGTAETNQLPSSLSTTVPNRRALRAAATKDFDDKMGDPAKTFQAVVFNPVPGPPMGANTRLGFRYWLNGTTALRVQIYSLSKGYHRHLTLTNLPQRSWHAATVDMTQARRPDGSGGPLAADERIDDIQFYVAPEAELLIDDIVLYEAAVDTDPFPRRIVFTGWFDTGKQGAGNEWPGDFEIAKHDAPLTWKAAKSITNAQTGQPWIRVHLRGQRPLSSANRLRFRYLLTGGDKLNVVLTNAKTGQQWDAPAREWVSGKWAEATVDFAVDKRPALADELRFLAPNNAELLIDDVLLFEPGGAPRSE